MPRFYPGSKPRKKRYPYPSTQEPATEKEPVEEGVKRNQPSSKSSFFFNFNPGKNSKQKN